MQPGLQQILWCFFSVTGRINRQAFALSMGVLILLSFALTRVVSRMVFGDELSAATSRTELAEGLGTTILIVGLVLFWPTVAIQVKRLNDLGRSYKTLILVFLAIVALGLFSPGLGLVANLAFTAYLIFAPGKHAILPPPART